MSVSRETAATIAAVFGAISGDEEMRFRDIPYEERFQHLDYPGPNVWPGEHEESSAEWLIHWCEGPYEWALDEKYSYLITAATEGKVWGEAVSSGIMALYPNDEAGAARARARLEEHLAELIELRRVQRGK